MKTGYITKTDIAVLIFCIYIFISGLTVSGMTPGNIMFTKWSICILLYILASLNRHKKTVFAIITAAGIAQGIAAIGQQIGLTESRHPLFEVTGFMGNPGQLGGFQAIAFSCCVLLMPVCRNRPRIIRHTLSASCVFLAYTLFISGSRAGLLAAITGIGITHINSVSAYLSRHRRHIPVYVALCSALSAALVMYRSESVMARLLIWNVTSGMIADKPLFGCGAGMFKMNYMEYQAEYFARNPESIFAVVADNAIYPYNKFLHLMAETGIIGLALAIVMLVMLFRDVEEKRQLAPLAAFLIFSCFSYPLSKFSLAMLFPLLAGSIGKGVNIGRSTRNVTSIAAIAMSIAALAYMSWYEMKSVDGLKSLTYRYDHETAEKVAGYIRRTYTDSRINALTAGLCKMQPEVLDKIGTGMLIPGCETWCLMAEYHISKNDMQAAERYLEEASHMIPTRIRPQYMLWKLYLSEGKYAEAMAAAQRTVEMEVKVSNTFSIRAKAEAAEWLRSNELCRQCSPDICQARAG
ncbi:MAG: O-antigen ligase family protein [Clostridium sp.]|nr:O-antigen ligase family protein [Bacteroides sp.]MCM1197589.1 O-antigen ligase family protein [Clostridium sp.]